MSPMTVSILALVVFLILIFNGLPIAFAFAIVGSGGLIILRGLEPGLSILAHTPFAWGTSVSILPLPLFILMGQFAFHSNISKDLYDTAYKWLGRLPGGIALATTLASTAFAACCGVSMAGVATMASIAYPEMNKMKYSRRLATGCIVAGGGLSSLIPPSIGFIIFGFLTKTSVARLFIAGIVPGIMTSFLFLIITILMCIKNPELGPKGPSFSWRDRLISLKGVCGMLILFLIVVGGLYFGIFTPSEAGATGASGALIISIVTGRMNFTRLMNATKDTLKTSCFIITMIIGANIFNTFLFVTGLTTTFSAWITYFEINRYIILISILILYIPLGMFLDIGAVLLLTVPIFVPPLVNLGFDPIWLGVLITMLGELGFMTPPVGVNLFVVQGVTHVPLSEVMIGSIPFAGMLCLSVVIMVFFPQIILFLPNLIS